MSKQKAPFLAIIAMILAAVLSMSTSAYINYDYTDSNPRQYVITEPVYQNSTVGLTFSFQVLTYRTITSGNYVWYYMLSDQDVIHLCNALKFEVIARTVASETNTIMPSMSHNNYTFYGDDVPVNVHSGSVQTSSEITYSRGTITTKVKDLSTAVYVINTIAEKVYE